MLLWPAWIKAEPGTPNGIVCPVCQINKHKILRSRKVPGAVERDRRCANLHEFKTLEAVKVTT